MSRLPLTLAISYYDHVADLVHGHVGVEGIDLTCLTLPIEEIFFRFLTYREFDVSEISMGKYAALISQGDDSVTAIPVFPMRIARHSSIYLRRGGPVQTPADLNGRRIGVAEWAQTASIYCRGLLAHEYGVDLSSIEWVQAGVNQPGRREQATVSLPWGFRLTPAPEKTLSDMLVSGEIDAAITAHPPDCFLSKDPNVQRLFEDFLEIERRYVQKTGIFPIMHAVAIRREVADQNPWVPMNLMKAFEEAKRRSIERALFVGSCFPIPWGYEIARRAQEALGEDYWPYGVEANRKTLEAFLQYAFEQGVCRRKLEPEELFPMQVQQRYHI